MLKKVNKRLFDIIFSFVGLIFFSWLIIILWFVASLSTCSNGFFIQVRIGKNGRPFNLIKIKTMFGSKHFIKSNITALELDKITTSGRWMRKFKLDELPQLWNILIGDMSFVGPRPDVPGYADKLSGTDRLILDLRPGITGPASIKYRNEEEILASCDDPKKHNDEVIWPDKVRLNLDYFNNHSLMIDMKYIFNTIF